MYSVNASSIFVCVCMVVFLLILIVYMKAYAIHSAIMIPQLLMNRDRELNTFLTLPRLREG